MKYREYISVDSDFIPVFSENSDKSFPEKWKSFYPHESFKNIVSQLLETLEQSSISKDKSIWMHGAYGTGKTFASFVIKHLLEDKLSNVEKYCKTNSMDSIYSRISNIRKGGDVLVVHRSSSSGINGDNRLFNSIITSIKDTLDKKGYMYKGNKSQYESILDKLKDTNSSFSFEKAFKKYQEKFEGYSSPSSVISALEEFGPDNSLELLDTLIEIGELENYNWSTTSDDVKKWIDDIRVGNNLQEIVFVWDEFTEYFAKNQNSITGLQNIAEASSRLRFYFLLITHSGSQIIKNQDSKKIIEARFKIHPIDMAEATAFKLMGQAIKQNSGLDEEWNNIIDGLWDTIDIDVQRNLMAHAKDITKSELKPLLPIHPYSAYLLKIISSEISSNQRTTFQFISEDYKNGDEEKHNFNWFINNYSSSYGDWNYLTSDFIWDYFFNNSNPDLDDIFKQSLTLYENYAPICEGDCQKLKVLKVLLLLSSLQQKSGISLSQGQSKLLRPTLNNITTAFTGTELHAKILEILNGFVSKGLFSPIQEGDDKLFVFPISNVDSEKFNHIYTEIKKEFTFEKLIRDNKWTLSDSFFPSGYLKYRYQLFEVNSNNYRQIVDKAKNVSINQIPLFFLFALDENDQAQSSIISKKIIENIGRNSIIIDFSETIFSSEQFQKYLKSKAEEKYYGLGTSHGKLAGQNMETIITNWKRKLLVTELTTTSTNVDDHRRITGVTQIKKILEEYNEKWFGCGLEKISSNDRLFSPTGFSETVVLAAMDRMTIPPNQSYLKIIMEDLVRNNIWSNSNYYLDCPNHVISKMKCTVEDLIKQKFQSNGSKVAITDIWNLMNKPPFGLFECAGSAFILGLILKEYADGRYYKFDGTNTINLNYNELADLIINVIKNKPKSRDQYILKQKPEHIEFCNVTGNVFKLTQDKRNSIQDVVKHISTFLTETGYPIWSLSKYVENNLKEDDHYDALISVLCDYSLLLSNEQNGSDSTEIAEKIYITYKQNVGLEEKLEEIMQTENMKNGMIYYIHEYKPDLAEILDKLVLDDGALLIELNKRMSADAPYIWNIDDIDRQIDILFEEYCLLDAVNCVLFEKKNNMIDSRESISRRISSIRIPIQLISEESSDLGCIIQHLINYVKGDIKLNALISEEINKLSNKFNDFLKNQKPLFKIILQKNMQNVSDEDLNYLYSQIKSETVHVSTDSFFTDLNEWHQQYREELKINQLHSLWRNNTQSESPIDWCKKNNICLSIVFEDALPTITHIVEMLTGNRYAKDEKKIDESIDYLEKKALPILKDISLCKKIFISNIAQDYISVIENEDEFLKYLNSNLSDEPLEWGDNRNLLKKVVDEYAETIYQGKVLDIVIDLIEKKSPQEIKNILNTLVKEHISIGIKIIEKEEENAEL